ncbi:MAG TPA: hypothetical protein PLS90_11250 [Candidatus Sumerlaeota bacterium]|nr:hypothetical protein [Candidatus Sumerlaeota bacterium]
MRPRRWGEGSRSAPGGGGGYDPLADAERWEPAAGERALLILRRRAP